MITKKEKEKGLSPLNLAKRFRRNRKNSSIRALVQENYLRVTDFVVPFFLTEENTLPWESNNPFYRWSINNLLKKAFFLHEKGVQAIALFPCIDPSLKKANGQEALNPDGLIPKAIEVLKKEIPSLTLILDLALDPFTSHGHDGIVDERNRIDNDATVHILGQMALLYAEKGADILAPSDMMDGRVGFIRNLLEKNQFPDTCIMSYSVKYASSFYAPFRKVVGSSLSFGDKKTYQMNPANSREALLEARQDEEEGADFLLVKPAGFYLDIIAKIKEKTNLPLAAYQVSGEYAMLKNACTQGLLPYPDAFLESLISIKRAGADLIFSYAVEEILPFF